ncbi:MAG: translation elongation factor-like protein [Planctomycetes bacterium GWF2_41_51]|nr:MAG: translation elongation factor-like protein [Planctomycetes bacterium GWF2_41_51]
MKEDIGKVSDFFSHPIAAGIELTGTLHLGDHIIIKGHTTDIEMTVNEIQVDHNDVSSAGAGESIGLKVPDRVRKGDHIYKVSP